MTHPEKVTIAQIRAFVNNSMHDPSCMEPKRLADILDFIDNGPPTEAPEDPKHYAVTFVGYGGTGVSVTTAYGSLTAKYGQKMLKVFEIDQETGDLTEVPKKPTTAEEIAVEAFGEFGDDWKDDLYGVVQALREAGLLKEGA